jgi:hypothetical protein
MKTCSLYGFISALAGAFLTLILFFAGLHSDPARLSAAGWIGGLGGLAIAVTCLVLGIKARRSEAPGAEEFGYGSAFGAGALISLVSAILSSIFTYIYHSFINPAFSEILLQDKLAKLEASGMSGDKLEKAESMTRTMLSPVAETVTVLILGFVFGVIISLIVAGFLKRPGPSTPPTL